MPMVYRLWIEDQAKAEINHLPGHVRQRIRRAIGDLSREPRPHDSRPLRLDEEAPLEVRRLRLDRWRVIYVVDEQQSEVGLPAVRKRPPYDYSHLPELLAGLQE
jgi:mRNA-degrading endonuclease RelE of RelBE toxin-antitoxin system